MTAISLWPVELPQRPKINGWAGGPRPNISAFTPAQGPDITRRVISAVGYIYDAQFEGLSHPQAVLFEQWFDDTLEGGSLQYYWKDPVSEILRRWKFVKADPVYTLTATSNLYLDLSFKIFRVA